MTVLPPQPPPVALAPSKAAPPTPARHAAIEVAHLTHRYPGTKAGRGKTTGTAAGPANARPPALDDVSFHVNPGEIFGILGPNGGGKTTLFRILATLMTPQPGTPAATDTPATAATAAAAAPTLRIGGHDVVREPAAVRRMLGVVFQQPSLDAKLTARENLVHQGRLHGLAGRDLHARIDEGLERFQLADRADEYTERLSGGMRRRVELAKAMLHEPRLLLMDEPATGLDPGARRELWRHLEDLRQHHGVTIAMTTHLMDEAERCDRLAILARGRLIALDTPANLKQRVGGDVITLEPATTTATATNNNTPAGDNEPMPAEALAQRIAERFGPWDDHARPRVVDGNVRFEKPDGAALVTAIISALPGQTRRITVGQPTLEDVFLDLTGAAFHDADA